MCSSNRSICLSEFLEDERKINLSVRNLTGQINRLIKNLDLAHIVPAAKVSNAMFSRLGRGPANTQTKRNTLRLLSFWIGYKEAVWKKEALTSRRSIYFEKMESLRTDL